MRAWKLMDDVQLLSITPGPWIGTEPEPSMIAQFTALSGEVNFDDRHVEVMAEGMSIMKQTAFAMIKQSMLEHTRMELRDVQRAHEVTVNAIDEGWI